MAENYFIYSGNCGLPRRRPEHSAGHALARSLVIQRIFFSAECGPDPAIGVASDYVDAVCHIGDRKPDFRYCRNSGMSSAQMAGLTSARGTIAYCSAIRMFRARVRQSKLRLQRMAGYQQLVYRGTCCSNQFASVHNSDYSLGVSLQTMREVTAM